jgi:protein-S-isoprenylcysteine O-methyltransferase Ste14
MELLIYLSYFFAISEIVLLISKRSKEKSASKRNDKGSLLILWFSIIISITAGFYFEGYGILGFTNKIIFYSGVLIFLTGLILRWGAIFQLKKAFTVDVSINKYHTLKTDGLYKKIRHPSYSGLLLILTGLSIAMNNIISFLIISISIFISISYRILIEEKLLTDEFGEKYKTYKSKTKKIIPGIY